MPSAHRRVSKQAQWTCRSWHGNMETGVRPSLSWGAAAWPHCRHVEGLIHEDMAPVEWQDTKQGGSGYGHSGGATCQSVVMVGRKGTRRRQNCLGRSGPQKILVMAMGVTEFDIVCDMCAEDIKKNSCWWSLAEDRQLRGLIEHAIPCT